jgi:hypothetical protein
MQRFPKLTRGPSKRLKLPFFFLENITLPRQVFFGGWKCSLSELRRTPPRSLQYTLLAFEFCFPQAAKSHRDTWDLFAASTRDFQSGACQKWDIQISSNELRELFRTSLLVTACLHCDSSHLQAPALLLRFDLHNKRRNGMVFQLAVESQVSDRQVTH